MVAYDDTYSDCRVRITQTVEGEKLNTARSIIGSTVLRWLRKPDPRPPNFSGIAPGYSAIFHLPELG